MTDKISELPLSELEVMQSIWKHSKTLTANEIIDEVNKNNDWSPKTVRTLLTRLMEKKFITRSKENKLYVYHALIDESAYKNKTTKTFINKLYDGALSNLVLNFVKNEELSKDEIDELKKMLDNDN